MFDSTTAADGTALPVLGCRGLGILKADQPTLSVCYLDCLNLSVHSCSNTPETKLYFCNQDFKEVNTHFKTKGPFSLKVLDLWAESNMRHVICGQARGFWLSEGKSGEICALLSDSICLGHKSAFFVAIQSN